LSQEEALPSTLHLPQIAAVLDRLFADAETVDAEVLPRARARAKEIGGIRNDSLLADILGDAYIPISPEVGKFLYMLARARRSPCIVEFGTSFGLSTIHLAAAVRDSGGGKVITTELHPGKVQRARRNLIEAGLLDYVEIREGDALETLRNLAEPIDFLFLDGWKNLYLPVLQLVEPRLAKGAFVAADDVDPFREIMTPLLDHLNDPAKGYVSVEVPLGDRLALAMRTA
jgi:predicted O-methyltransferase YrrM